MSWINEFIDSKKIFRNKIINKIKGGFNNFFMIFDKNISWCDRHVKPRVKLKRLDFLLAAFYHFGKNRQAKKYATILSIKF